MTRSNTSSPHGPRAELIHGSRRVTRAQYRAARRYARDYEVPIREMLIHSSDGTGRADRGLVFRITRNPDVGALVCECGCSRHLPLMTFPCAALLKQQVFTILGDGRRVRLDCAATLKRTTK